MKTAKISNLLRCKKGTTFPLVIAVTLSLMIVFVGISEYLRLVIIASGVRDALQSAIIVTVNDNYAHVYHSVREGYAAGYQPNETGFKKSINYGNIYAQIDKTLGTHESSGKHIKFAGENIEFEIYDLLVEIENPDIAPSSKTQDFAVKGWVMVEVPVSFGNKVLPPMKIKLHVRAAYSEIF